MNPIRCLPLAALLALLCLSASPAPAQAAGPVQVAPVAFGLDGDAAGQRFDPDPRFALPALHALWEEGDERALQTLLGAGAALEAREFARLALANALRNRGWACRRPRASARRSTGPCTPC